MQLRPLLTRFDSAASCLQPLLLLAIRLYWGISFALGGWGKLHRLDEIAKWFGDELHIPFPKLNAIMASSTECFGGALLALGLFARPVSVPLIFTMIVAYATADREALMAITSDPDKFVSAAPFLFLLASVIVLAFGPGRFSLDAWFFRKTDAAK
ncbi:MAG TPA: DoxX family protein [Lacunisphaera sp.]|nr:DoxX family protein [Lacunisphaera sp.]